MRAVDKTMDNDELLKLKVESAKIRMEILKMLKWRRYGHIGGSLSIVELLCVLYNKHLRHDPENPKWEDRDYVVLSKGHAGPALYSALALQGYFPEDMLYTLNEGGTRLPSHPDKNKTPGVDVTTGDLGQGTSVAAGLAYGLKLKGSKQRVYLIVGDGELNEGQCWEAFQFIASNRLNNIIVIIDENKKQLDGPTEKVIYPFDIAGKMRAFGFYTIRVKGSSEEDISSGLEELYGIEDHALCMVLDTVKGQGVKFFEDMADNHSVKFNNEVDIAADCAIKKLKSFIEHGGIE
jgi:transketolase